MRRLIPALAALALLTTPAFAAPCKDAKGKFVKCPEAAKPKGPCKDTKGKFVKCPEAAKPKGPCKDTKGKFVKCGTPGAKPIK